MFNTEYVYVKCKYCDCEVLVLKEKVEFYRDNNKKLHVICENCKEEQGDINEL